MVEHATRIETERGSWPVALPMAGRRFLVTGGARGIGAAVVSRLAAYGASGAIIDLGATEETTQIEGTTWASRSADVTDETAMREVTQRLIDDHGPFDGLVAAAGIVPSWHSPEDIDLAVWESTMAVNVRGVVIAMKCVTPTMPPRSTVVAIGSLNSWRGDPNILAYVASKHAVLGVVRASAMSLGKRGIRVNAVAPGPVATEALLSRIDGRADATGKSREQSLAASAELTALGRLASPEDVADAVLFLSSAQSAAITGHLLPVDGGLS